MSAETGKRCSGQIIVLAPVMLIVLSGILALTADVGNLFVWRAKLQNAADAASLAGARVLIEQRLSGATETSARATALAEARAIQQANTAEAGATIEFGSTNGCTFTPLDVSKHATAVRVKALRNGSAPGGMVRMSFASLLGIRSCEVGGTAVAQATSNIRGVLVGLAPFAVPKDRLVDPGQVMVFYPADGEAYNGLGDLTVVPGCFGLLNLDGGSLGTQELIDWITYGYQGYWGIDPDEDGLWIDGTSGFRAALQKAMKDKIGQEIVVVIYDQVTGQGSNGEFHCIGFVRGTITEVKLTGKPEHISFRIGQIGTLKDLISGGGYPSPNLLKIQLAM